MSQPTQVDFPDPRQDMFSRNVFGFWIYLMTDCIIFASLFATYAVLHRNTYGGPSGHDLFSAPYTLAETLALLISSFTCGPAMMAALKNKKGQSIFWFSITFLLGATFLALELHEFHDFIVRGDSWQTSGFLTAFFTLVGTHGTHITFGLIWILTIIGQIAFRGLTLSTLRRITCLRLFWHFLDVVWIFIFTFVYMMEIIG